MKTIKLTSNDKSRVYFTSDLHAYHFNILKYCNRPFLCPSDAEYLKSIGGDWTKEPRPGQRIHPDSVENMNRALTKNINAVVREQDILIHSGDWAFGNGPNYIRNCHNFRYSLNCRNIYAIWGNHDEDNDEFGHEFEELFISTHDLLQVIVNGQKIILSHYLMGIWPKNHKGAWHLYGHSHSQAEEWADKVMPGRRAFDCGIDNAFKILGEYRPFSFEEVAKIMHDRKGCFVDHHREGME